MPDSIRASVESQLNTTIKSVQRCSGGDINQAVRLQTAGADYFVKWHTKSPPGMFPLEAKGLRLLADSTDLKIPAVIAASDDPAYLVLEWLEEGRKLPSTDVALGEGLASLHLNHAAKHGLDHDNYIALLYQPNTQTESWAEFYGERRIRVQMNIARQNSSLSSGLEKNLETLIERLPDLVPDVEASLMHGDLWRGNVMVLEGGHPAIIDPAVYYGHREVELAMTEVFGGFSREFYDAYSGVYPVDKGYNQRRSLYQLYPMMTHMNLFGGGYTSRVQSIVRQYI
ncbi:MAG: fructosamine kinase family protein [Chloroflexi bacterium]|nr:fructosamine kinase family protein [Chloroflexota bacterium]